MKGQALLLICILTIHTVTSNTDRRKRNIGIFNVVRFQNEVCEGSNKQQGTCFTTDECEKNGGEASGSCAEGCGVCCTFSVNCGGRQSQNNTVFMSNNPVAGECSATICPIDGTISQLRLDFTTFAIGEPSDGTAPSGINLLNGVATPDAAAAGNGVLHSTGGQCLQDSFVVTSPGASGSDVICGTNSGEHLYIEASQACNKLMFLLGREPAMEPMWSITVRQYANDHTNLAPTGCNQYHFDMDDTDALSVTGIVASFNYNNGNGRHLANQDQTICIRREEGMTRVCFSQAGGMQVDDFRISTGSKGDSMMMSAGLVGKLAGAGGPTVTVAHCGNYGTDGKGVDYDYLHIPRPAAKIGAALFPIASSNFCGAALVAKGFGTNAALTTMGMPAGKMLAGPAATTATTAGAGTAKEPGLGFATVCTTGRPFRIRFVSDIGETAKETLQHGFSLGYEQS